MISLMIFLLTIQCCQSFKSAQNDVKNNCPTPNVGQCVCNWIGTKYCEVTCHGLDTVPRSLPPQTYSLAMTDGTIKNIPGNYLKKLKLFTLNLRNNIISNSFYIPHQVIHMDVSNNCLSSLTIYRLLHNLTLLGTLKLNGNQVTNGVLKPGTFKDLKSLFSLSLNGNGIKSLQVGIFSGLKKLDALSIRANQITVLKRGFLDGIGQQGKSTMSEIDFSYNEISHVEDGAFDGQLLIKKIDLKYNNLTSFPDIMVGLNPASDHLTLSNNQISDLSALSKTGYRTISMLSLDSNNITAIPPDTFKKINVVMSLDLSFNFIEEIQPKLFQGSDMSQLVLLHNRLRRLEKDSFAGLKNLKGVFLSNNELEILPDSLFENVQIANLFLSKNKFTMLTGRPFKGMKKSGVSINLFSNDIHTIEKEFLEDLEGTTKITVDCQSLKSVPHLPRSAEIFCTEYNSHRWINHLPLSVSKSLSKSAYLCKTINQFAQNCMPCIKGTFGAKGKCFNCSAGGFFQDELAQMYCKRCNIGTFVHPNNAPATGPLMCQACPQGTQSSEWSGYRACKCLKSFYRFDRFGRCFPCSRQGWNCTNDYASLSEGYYWKWKNESMKNDYSNYIKNLMVEGKEYTSGVWTFTGSLPVPHKCPLNSCRGGLNSSCVTGYHGPLCSLCDVGYYKRANSCIRCPSRIWATVEVVIVILLFVFILLAIMLGDRKKVDNEKGRTIADKILSCFKIVLGFYQVILKSLC